eukprot:13199243-Heterocapsa_arctica.AAC.1
MRAMERQQQMAAGEQSKQTLLQQMAMDSGVSASSFRSIYSDDARKAKAARMLNPNAGIQASEPRSMIETMSK